MIGKEGTIDREIAKSQIDELPAEVFGESVVLVPLPVTLIQSIKKAKTNLPITNFIASAVGHYIEDFK